MTLAVAILTCAVAAGTCHAVADPGAASFAVRVEAPPGAVVRLRALDVPRGWTASFCTPRICSPSKVALALRGRTGTIQISYVPGAANAAPLRTLHVSASSPAGRVDARRSRVP